MRNWLRVALAVVTLLLTARATRAATVQTVDGQIHAGELVSIDAGVLTVNPAGDGASPVKVPLEDIVQVLPHGVAPAGPPGKLPGGSGGPLVDNDGVHPLRK